MQFTQEHKDRLAAALRKAWVTKRAKAVVGEVKVIGGVEKVRCRSEAGWLYWKELPGPVKSIPVEEMTNAQRSRARAKGMDIPFKKRGVPKGYIRPVSTRLKQSVSRRKYLFDVGAIARDQKNSVRKSLIYRLWREDVFNRDGFTCQDCGAKNGNGKYVYLEAHHIKPYATHPAVRFVVSNGITLCKECHRKVSATQMVGNGNGRRKASNGITPTPQSV